MLNNIDSSYLVLRKQYKLEDYYELNSLSGEETFSKESVRESMALGKLYNKIPRLRSIINYTFNSNCDSFNKCHSQLNLKQRRRRMIERCCSFQPSSNWDNIDILLGDGFYQRTLRKLFKTSQSLFLVKSRYNGKDVYRLVAYCEDYFSFPYKSIKMYTWQIGLREYNFIYKAEKANCI